MYYFLLGLLSLLINNSIQAQNIEDLSVSQIDSLLFLYKGEGQFDKALLYALKSVEKTEGKDSIHAVSWGNLGNLYQVMQKAAESEAAHLKAMAIREKTFGKKHPEYALSLKDLAILYTEMGNTDKAAAMLLEASEIQKKALGDKNPFYALTLNSLGILYHNTQQFNQAEQLFLKALNIFKTAYGTKHEDYCSTLSNMAYLYLDMDRLEEAEKFFVEALGLWEKIYSKSHTNYIYTLNNLALLYDDMGNYEQAESAYKEVITGLGSQHPEYATCLKNLAGTYKNMGRFEQAESLYKEVLVLYKKNLGDSHPNYASSLHGIAIMYMTNDEFEKAKPYLLESLDIYKRIFGENHAACVRARQTLASLYHELGQYEKVEKIYLEVIALNKKTVGSEHTSYAISIANLGRLYCDLGRFDQAEKLYKEAAAIQLNSLGEHHAAYIEVLLQLANLYRDSERYDIAIDYYHQAIKANTVNAPSEINISKLNDYEYYSNPSIVKTLSTYYRMTMLRYDKTGDMQQLEQGYLLLQAGLNVCERVRNSFSSETDKLEMLSKTSQIISKTIESGLLLKKKDQAIKGFDYAELNKSILLTDALKGSRARALGDLPDSLVAEEIRLQEKMKQLKKQQAEAKSEEEKNTLVATFNALSLEIESFQKSLKNKYPKYHQLKYQNITAKASDVQQSLDNQTMLIEYFIADTLVHLFAITKEKVALYPIPISKKILANKIENLRKSLSDYAFIANKQSEAFELYTNHADWFYKNLLAPALKDKNIKNLVVICDGELGHLPFESFLVETAKQGSNDYKKLHYLVNDYNISYNYSATLFVDAVRNENLITKKQHTGLMLACASAYPKIDSSLLALRMPNDYKLRQGLNPLPEVEKEVRALSELFQGTFTYDSETNEGFFKKNAKDYAVIHLAMHGILNPKSPILSSLAFTENRDSLEDNFLQAFEIAQINLQADLVVLSACETGYGQFTQGEGVISLARSFMYAGTPSLVVSLWQVNDQATAIIMQNFYQQLANGMTKDAALRQAKLDYIKVAEGIAAHPAFWSAFIQLGDSKPIYLKRKGGWTLWVMGGAALVLGGIALAIRRKKKNE